MIDDVNFRGEYNSPKVCKVTCGELQCPGESWGITQQQYPTSFLLSYEQYAFFLPQDEGVRRPKFILEQATAGS